jgi:DNA-binding transcriptional regulator YhcF (GntR family)
VSVSESDESGGRKFDVVQNTLMSRLSDGTYRLGAMLPAQREIAADLGVSRDTVRHVVKQMTDHGYLETTQGRGSKVVKVPQSESVPPGRPQLYHSMHQAFKRSEVSLDVVALTAESFVGHFELQVGRVEAGELDLRKLSVRVLLPSEDVDHLYPRGWAPGDTGPQERWRRMARENAGKLRFCRTRLESRGVEADVRIRRVRVTPLFKLYVINGTDMLYGLYDPVRGPMELMDGTKVSEDAVDVKGVGVTLIQYGPGSVEFDLHGGWFQRHWDLSDEDAAEN